MLVFLKNKTKHKTTSIFCKQNFLWDWNNKTEEFHKEGEELDSLSDVSVIPSQLKIPANISFPRVDVHSLILDFSTVSFVDISAVKGLKMVHQTFMTSRHGKRLQDFKDSCQSAIKITFHSRVY